MPKLHLITYGCQMNEYDSERVAGLLKNERRNLHGEIKTLERHIGHLQRALERANRNKARA